MSFSTFTVGDTTYSVIKREPWGGNVLGAALMGANWAYYVQSSSGELFGIIVQYPFTAGSNINTDNIVRDVEMIKIAFETDLEGLLQRGRKTQYEINAKQPPYDAILTTMP